MAADPASPAAQRAIVERYFAMMQAGDPEIGSLFCEEIVWVAPQSSPVGRRHEGKAAVLALMGQGTGLYDVTHPMSIDFATFAAEGEAVFVEFTLTARTGQGEPYENHYVFLFRIRDGLIHEIHEHLDTHYAQRKLFDPKGIESPLDAPPRS